MNFTEALQAELTRPGPKCAVDRTLKLLPDDTRAEVEAALASDISATAISRALRAVNADVSAFTLNRHRRGECACGR